MPDTVTHASTMAPPATLTIKVIHGRGCPCRKDPSNHKCDCRKQLYIYENGKDRTESAKTKSWKKAQALADERMGEFDPSKIAARKLDEERARLLAIEERKQIEAQSKRILFTDAVTDWQAGLGIKSRSRTTQYRCLAKKILGWAGEKNLTYLDEATPALLYAWYGGWSETAKNPRDRLAPGSRNVYVAALHRFFKWAVMVDYLAKDPSVVTKRQTDHDRIQTKPLTSDEQFREILAATYQLDANRFTYRHVPEYGRDLRAIYLLQRWTGIRIGDALALKRSDLRVCPYTHRTLMTIITQKKKKLIKDRPLPTEVVEALNAIPRAQEHVRPGYFFWSSGASRGNLTGQWNQRTVALNAYLSLTDEDGQPMTFHSHMLRDTFAVELLLQDVDIHEVSKLLTHESILMT